MREVKVVFDMESWATPYPIGVYVSTDEDVIRYDTGTEVKAAPVDCVKVVRVLV